MNGLDLMIYEIVKGFITDPMKVFATLLTVESVLSAYLGKKERGRR